MAALHWTLKHGNEKPIVRGQALQAEGQVRDDTRFRCFEGVPESGEWGAG